jgi:hypothetical protein
MNAATLVKLVMDRVLSSLEGVLGKVFGFDPRTAAPEFMEAIRAEVRKVVDQAIIELKFAEMDLQVREMDLERMVQREEEAQALARGRANAMPDVEIVPPKDEPK